MPDLLQFGADLVAWAASHLALAVALLAVLMIPGAVCCWAAHRGVVISRAAFQQMDKRLTHLSTAVGLLTDAAEDGLRSAFSEIEQIAWTHEATGDEAADLQTRVGRAARRGRHPREIAQAEGLAEGEVRLRLKLQGASSIGNAAQASP
jgi:hypothetical protein